MGVKWLRLVLHPNSKWLNSKMIKDAIKDHPLNHCSKCEKFNKDCECDKN